MKSKKILAFLLSMTLIGGMMNGCGSSTASQTSSAKITDEKIEQETEQKTEPETEQETEVCVSETESSESAVDMNLVNAIADNLKHQQTAYYTNLDWTSVADSLPSKFDLRDRGVVPEIHNQGEWGNCWSFASIAACEISQLSTLGVTTEEFKDTVGFDMDLSERHLAWFGTSHLPTLDQYSDGEYPYDESQAGEGLWSIYEDTDLNKAHFGGGNLQYSSSVFANGVGPELESDWPYMANDGTSSKEADWSIPEESRYAFEAEMLNCSILPSPVGTDENGSYVYNAAGTEAIKQELLSGRGVSIMYHGDMNMSDEATYKITVDAYINAGYPQDLAEIFAGIQTQTFSLEELTLEQKKVLMKYYLMDQGTSEEEITEEMLNTAISEQYDDMINVFFNASTPDTTEEDTTEAIEGTEEDTSEDTSEQDAAEQEAKLRKALESMGQDYDEYMEYMTLVAELSADVYINVETYAQYTDNMYALVDHGVTIVGWDDDYAVSNFLPDHQPPAAGAWICRNSWGAGYGNDGYFYLSYYDQTISFAESFEFIFDSNAPKGVNIDTYDNMEVGSIFSVDSDTSAYMANVFPVDEEAVLSYISVMTTELNTSVTANVYLLNENYTSPTDGVLLETVTEECKFAGYHRIPLDYDYELPAGSVISVVERQQDKTADGDKTYTLAYSSNVSKEYNDAFQSGSWSVGIINEGESFIYVDGKWYDWKNIIDAVNASSAVAELYEFDNLNIKAYLYTVEGVEEAHDFSETEVYGGAKAMICNDCGETVVIVE